MAGAALKRRWSLHDPCTPPALLLGSPRNTTAHVWGATANGPSPWSLLSSWPITRR
jgi:hypothetical protein